MLPHHDRYEYSPIVSRTPYGWPNGARLAVYLGLNLEHFGFGESLGAELAPGGPPPGVLNYAWRDWGNRVGAWRVLDMLNRLEMPASVIANSAMFDYAPELMYAFRARGDEVVGHGRTNSERQSGLSEPAERALIAEATRVLTEADGPPRAAGSAPGSPRAALRRICWPKPVTRIRSICAWTTRWFGCEPAQGVCSLSLTRRRSTTSRRSSLAKTAQRRSRR